MCALRGGQTEEPVPGQLQLEITSVVTGQESRLTLKNHMKFDREPLQSIYQIMLISFWIRKCICLLKILILLGYEFNEFRNRSHRCRLCPRAVVIAPSSIRKSNYQPIFVILLLFSFHLLMLLPPLIVAISGHCGTTATQFQFVCSML